MLIAVDANEANVEKRVGIGQFALETIRQLSNLSSDKSDVFNLFLKEDKKEFLPDERKNFRYKIVGPKFLWTQLALPVFLFSLKEKPRVFFSPSHYAPRFSPIPTVISIMDLSFIHFPQFFTKKDLYQLKNWTAYSVKKAAKIITISQFSKKDISDYYRLDPEKIEVVYPGYDKDSYNQKEVNPDTKSALFKKLKITGDFILFTGTIQPRKNIGRLVDAFGEVRRKKRLQLVLVGKKGWQYQPIIDKITKQGGMEIILTDYLSNEDLAILYKSARCFVLPSLFEGFGLPLIEAMACGCPAIISDSSSLPEIAGDAAIKADPYNHQSIAKAILNAGYNESYREQMIKKGFKNASRFDWRQTGDKIYNILKETGGES